MNRFQLRSQIEDLANAAGDARQVDRKTYPHTYSDAMARLNEATLAILAEFDRLYAIAYPPRVNPVNTVTGDQP